MQKEVKVSVVMPSYNAARFVTAAVDSVLAQTFQDFEILVVDDGSTDNTREVLEKYSSPKVRYLYKKNGGVSSARNFGIENARGKYIAFLDADDLWLPEKLEKQVDLLEENEDIGLCYTGAEKVSEDLTPKGFIDAIPYKDSCEKLLLTMNIIVLSSSIVRRSVILKTTGFDSQFSTCADKEFWLRLSLITRFAPISDYLVMYRDVNSSMSSNPLASKRDTLGVLNKFFTLPNLPDKYKKLRNKAVSNNLMVVSGEFLHNREFNESLNCMWESLKLYPLNIVRPLGLPFRLIKRLLLN